MKNFFGSALSKCFRRDGVVHAFEVASDISQYTSLKTLSCEK